MSEGADNGRPPMGVYVVNLVVTIAGTAVPRPAAYCETKEEAERLARELAAEAQQVVSKPQVRELLMGFIGVSNLGTNIRFVPRHSQVAIAPANSPLIVGKA